MPRVTVRPVAQALALAMTMAACGSNVDGQTRGDAQAPSVDAPLGRAQVDATATKDASADARPAREANASDAVRGGPSRDGSKLDAEAAADAAARDGAPSLLFPVGSIHWGANGHTDFGVYAPAGSISLAQQVADLKNVFGTTPNTILYRAVGESTKTVNSVVTTLQASGIVPSMLLVGYPDVATFANEAEAYAYGYGSRSSQGVH